MIKKRTLCLSLALMLASAGIYLGARVSMLKGDELRAAPRAMLDEQVLRVPRADPPCYDTSNRFADCGNGTVTDQVTGLIWLKDSNCLTTANYANANARAALLGEGTEPACNLTDGSSPGDWRLPTEEEWDVILNRGKTNGCEGPYPLPDVSGLGCCETGPCPFIVTEFYFWTSTTRASLPDSAAYVYMELGITPSDPKITGGGVWPVRGGR